MNELKWDTHNRFLFISHSFIPHSYLFTHLFLILTHSLIYSVPTPLSRFDALTFTRILKHVSSQGLTSQQKKWVTLVVVEFRMTNPITLTHTRLLTPI